MPRGAKPGNLNAAGPRGIALSFWSRRALRPQDSWARQIVKEYTERRIIDLGGEENVTQGQRSVIHTAAICHAVVCLIFAASKERDGLLKTDEDGSLALTGAAKELPKFLARIQAAEVALGVGPKITTPDQDAFSLMKAAIPIEGKRVGS